MLVSIMPSPRKKLQSAFNAIMAAERDRRARLTHAQRRAENNARIRTLGRPTTRRYTNQNAATVIQARIRGMLARGRMANPHTNIGRRAVMAMFTRSPNRRATGARIRASLRYGPERHISPRPPRASLVPLYCGNQPCGLSGPPRRRSPRRNNNNNLYR